MKKAETFTSILDLLKEYTVKISAFYLISFIKMTIIWSFRGERGFRGESVKSFELSSHSIIDKNMQTFLQE